MQDILNKNEAEIFLVKAFQFFANDSEILSLFLNLSGLNLETLRDTIHEPEFFLGILDFLEKNEKFLIQFSQKENYLPCAIEKVRFFLNKL